MKRKILSCILMGALVLSLSACGEDTSTTNDSIATDTTQENEVVESIVEELENPSERSEEELEEMVEEAKEERVAEMLLPAFEAHPLLKGNVVVGGNDEEAIKVLGEPDSTMLGEMPGYLIYTITNSNGISIDGRFSHTSSTSKEIKGYICDNVTSEYFSVDNDYYTITNDAYMEIKTIVDDIKNKGELMAENLTYEDVVNAFGTPGYIYKIDGDNGVVNEVSILWVNPEADGETSKTYVQAGFNADGTSAGWFGSIAEVSGTLR